MRSYTMSEVAQLLGIHEETVKLLVRSGELVAHSVSLNPKSRKPRWRVTDADLTAFRLSRQNMTKEPTQPRRKRSAGPIREYV